MLFIQFRTTHAQSQSTSGKKLPKTPNFIDDNEGGGGGWGALYRQQWCQAECPLHHRLQNGETGLFKWREGYINDGYL